MTIRPLICFCFVFYFKAAVLTSKCAWLRKLGHSIRTRPFGFEDTPLEEIDSFLLYTSTLTLSVSINIYIPSKVHKYSPNSNGTINVAICHCVPCLTHWGRDKMDAISQTTFSSAFSWMKIFEFPIKISLKFVPKRSINNIPALVQIMAWRRPGAKPLSGPIIASLLKHICVTRPQWVKAIWLPSNL